MPEQADKLLQSLIAKGVITQEEFDRRVEEMRNDPNSIPNQLLMIMTAIAEAYETALNDNLTTMNGLAEVFERLLALEERVNNG